MGRCPRELKRGVGDGWVGGPTLTFTLETESTRDSPPCTSPHSASFCLGGPALTLCGGRGPPVLSECWPCQVAASFLIRKPRGEEATCHLRAWHSLPAVCEVEPAPGPHPDPTLLHTPVLSSRRLHIALPVLLAPSLVDNHQPLFAAASFPTLPGLPKTRLRFWC